MRRIILLAILSLSLLGCSFGSRSAGDTLVGEVEAVAGGEAMVDSPAPSFTLTTTGGERLSLDEMEGQAVVLNFWATWCAPCRLEMPELQAVYERYQPQGVQVIGVEVDSSGSAADSAAFVREVGVTFPITRDVGGHLENAYVLRSALPTTVLIDQRGNVAYIHLGPITEEFLTEKLTALGL